MRSCLQYLLICAAEFLASLSEDASLPGVDEDLQSIKDAAKGTCQWIYTTAAYKQWFHNPSSSTLLLTGKMGSGKSTLTKHILHTLKDCQQTPEDAVPSELFVYYFCSHIRRQDECAELLLKTLIYQVLIQRPDLFNSTKLGKDTTTPTSWPVQRLWKYFQDLVGRSGVSKVYCIIDALDECKQGSAQELLESYAEFCDDGVVSGLGFRLFISKRHSEGPVDGLSNIQGVERIHVSPDQVLPDIKTAMTSRVNKITFDLKLKDEYINELNDAIVLKADGMFLWVDIALNRVLKNPGRRLNFDSLLEEITSMPPLLEDLYNRELDRIVSSMGEDEIELVKHVLAWVLLACRRITESEMIMALSVNESNRSLPTKRQLRVSAPAFVAAILAHFIEIRSSIQTTDGERSKDDSVIRPIYESARQFLWEVCMNPQVGKPLPQLYIGEAPGHEILARACIAYICCSEFSCGWIGRKELNEFGQIKDTDDMRSKVGAFLKSHHLLAYLSENKNLLYHIRQCTPSVSDIYDVFVDAMFAHTQAINLVRQCRQYQEPIRSDPHYWPPGPLLYFIVGAESLVLLERFVEKSEKVDWNEQDESGNTVLFYLLGSPPFDDDRLEVNEIVQYLLDKGVDPNLTKNFGETAAYDAVNYGHLEAINCLIQRNVDLKVSR